MVYLIWTSYHYFESPKAETERRKSYTFSRAIKHCTWEETPDYSPYRSAGILLCNSKIPY